MAKEKIDVRDLIQDEELSRFYLQLSKEDNIKKICDFMLNRVNLKLNSDKVDIILEIEFERLLKILTIKSPLYNHIKSYFNADDLDDYLYNGVILTLCTHFDWMELKLDYIRLLFRSAIMALNSGLPFALIIVSMNENNYSVIICKNVKYNILCNIRDNQLTHMVGELKIAKIPGKDIFLPDFTHRVFTLKIPEKLISNEDLYTKMSLLGYGHCDFPILLSDDEAERIVKMSTSSESSVAIINTDGVLCVVFDKDSDMSKAYIIHEYKSAFANIGNELFTPYPKKDFKVFNNITLTPTEVPSLKEEKTVTVLMLPELRKKYF